MAAHRRVAPDLFEGVGGFGDGQRIAEMIYLPLARSDPRFISMAVRTSGEATALAGALRRATSSLDPNLPLYWLRPMSEAIEETTFLYTTFGSPFAIFGFSSLFLAAVGLYGVIDFSVSSRMREMGLRMALGAEGGNVVGLVMKRVLRQIVLGVAIGLGIGAALGRPLAATLFGVEAWDPLVYGTIVSTLVLTGVLAALIPVTRAVRVDPVIALRA